MLTFIANDENGLPQKRNHIQRACEKCRKRKKRCQHVNSTQKGELQHKDNYVIKTPRVSPSAVGVGSPIARATTTSSRSVLSTGSVRLDVLHGHLSNTSAISPASRDYEALAPAPEVARTPEVARLIEGRMPSSSEDLEGDNSSFVGDLNPEAIFLTATSPQKTTSGESEGVGVWSTHKVIENIRASLSGPSRKLPSSSIFNADPVVSRLLVPYLQDQCMKLLPEQTDYAVLESIYLEEIHPIFPVLDTLALKLQPEKSASDTLLRQAICLAASTNYRAKSHLRLDSDLILSHKGFAEKLSRAIRTTLDLGLVRDKMVLIQVLALLSLFMQISDDKHLSADLNARAVSLVQTLGLHLRTQGTRKDHVYVTRLFCCIWTLDRLNAAFHGRPVLMHDRDFGHDMDQCIAQQEPAFQLMLRNVDLLDRVISLYRPTNNPPEDFQEPAFPTFEQLLDLSGAYRVKSHLVATIETFYHAVAMLSYRARNSQAIVVQAAAQSATQAAAQVRQSLSASRVTSVVGDEFHGQLSLLPFVPYSLSLALRVSYRDLRTNKAPIFRARARKQMLEQCRLLRELGEIFWSAVVMVELAEQTIREMDKVTFNVVGHQKLQLEQEQQFSRRQSQHEAPVDQQEQSKAHHVAEQHQMNGLIANPESTINGETTAGLSYLTSEEMMPLPSTYDPNDFDFSLLDDMADYDVFQHFDPSIDLDTIDATLGDFTQPYEFMGFPG